MSSLRLALKQSLENAGGVPGNGKGKKSLYQHPDTLFKSDKELRRLQRLEEKKAAAFEDGDEDEDDDSDDEDVSKPAKRGKKKRKKEKKKSEGEEEEEEGEQGRRKTKTDHHRRKKESKDLMRRREREEELLRRRIIATDGGTEIDATTGSVSSSSLSSSSCSSGSSSSDSSGSNSSSDSHSSTSSTGSSSSEDDTSGSSTDDEEKSSSSGDDSSQNGGGVGEAKGWKKGRFDDDENGNDLDSTFSDSEDTIDIADRETKMLFDADLSNDEFDENDKQEEKEEEDGSAEDERRRRRMEKKRRMLKRKWKRDDAANTIKTLWKKNKKSWGGDGGVPKVVGVSDMSGTGGGGGLSTSRTVEPPTPDVLRHIQSMSNKCQRRSVYPGLRVKVRFLKKTRDVHGRTTRNLKWYGGVISCVANDGRKIKVHYDDGTNEVSDFPDKDIVIDDVNNGLHAVSVGGKWGTVAAPAFAPLVQRTSPPPEEGEETVTYSPHPTNDTVKHGASNDAELVREGVDNDDETEKHAGEGRVDAGNEETERNAATAAVARKLKKAEKKKCGLERISNSDREEEGGDGNGKCDEIAVVESTSLPSGHDTSNTFINEVYIDVERDGRLSKDDDGGLHQSKNLCEGGGGDQVMKPPYVPPKDEGILLSSEAFAMAPLSTAYDTNMTTVKGNAASHGVTVTATAAAAVIVVNSCHSTDYEKTISTAATDTVDDKLLPSHADAKMREVQEKPVDELPDGWTHRFVRHKMGEQRYDPYWFSPEQLYKFNSIVKVKRFLACLEKAGGDEVVAYGMFTRKDKKGAALSVTNKEMSHEKVMITSEECDIPPSAVASTVKEQQDHVSALTSPPLETTKKLRIRIGLPGAKRKKQMEEEMRIGNNEPAVAVVSALPNSPRIRIAMKGHNQSAAIGTYDETMSSPKIEPSKKKQKSSSQADGDNETGGDGSIGDEVIKYSELSSAPLATKKLKLAIKLNTKKRQQHQESKADDEKNPAVERNNESQESGDRMKSHKIATKVGPIVAEGIETAVADDVVDNMNPTDRQNKADYEAHSSAEMNDGSQEIAERNEALKLSEKLLRHAERVKVATADPVIDDLDLATATSTRSDDDRSSNVNIPMSIGPSTTVSPALHAGGYTVDDDHAYSMAQSGRKAAKIAAKKLANPKKEERKKKKKAEEDPWVQCDRCHKWRHLPRTINLDSLPEHWFCELNVYDPKRSNCEAEEQTPKEVAKEKKRAKKLAMKKLEFEQSQAAAGEEVHMDDTKPKSRMELTSTFPQFDAPDENVVLMSSNDASEKHLTDDDYEKPKAKRGRPRNEGKVKSGKSKDADAPKQEWVQCEKCEKWRRIPPRISAEDLPDVWYCSMNTWDIHLASCTAIEDKHEASPARTTQFSEQSQIPSSFASGNKLSYRNLIFGSGRSQKKISERMRAQASLFSTQEQDDADMSLPPTVAYANSSKFYNKSLHKVPSFDDVEVPQPISVFDILSHSRAWQELNNNASIFYTQNTAAYNSVGYEKYCRTDGTQMGG